MRKKIQNETATTTPPPMPPDMGLLANCVAKEAAPSPPKRQAEIAKLEFAYVLIDELNLDWDVAQSTRAGIARRLADIKLRGW